MKYLIFLLFLMNSLPAENSWLNDPEKALKTASESSKPVLIDFYAEWCGPCKMMDKTTLKNDQVVKALESFVLLKVDGDKFQEFTRKYQVSGYPTFIILNTHGENIATVSGFKDAPAFVKWINQYTEAAKSGASLAELDKNDFKLLEMLKSGQEAKAAFEVVTEQVFQNEYKKNKLILELNKIAKEKPNAFLEILNHESLSCRLLVSQIYMNLLKDKFEYDPWDPQEKRKEQIAKLKGLLK